MTTKTDARWYQQGDVIIEPVADLPAEAKKVEAKPRGYVLAEGEVTGHAHVIDRVADIEFVEKDGMFFIKNKKPVTVRHEEHKPVTVPAGTWRVRGVREFDHFAEEARRVID